MLSINDLSYFIGGRPIFKDASLHINEKDKVGLIGPNGSGKTTLLNIILGNLQIDDGTITKHKDSTVGLLNQEIGNIDEDHPILSVAMQAFDDLLRKKDKIDRLINKIEEDPQQKFIEDLSILQHEFEIKGGYTLQSKAEEILEGIGFSTNELNKPMNKFSGGWKMRVILARLLLEKPSILMLDEPTNHLDLPSIKWFENYIKSYDGAVIIVSHDKQFLDNTVNKVFEIESFKLIQYHGNYSDFIQEKYLRKEVQDNAHLNQQKKIKQAEKFINRFRAKASKARQVQSKIKLMDKIELIEKSADGIKEIDFEFRIGQTSGKHVLDIKHVSKSYGEKDIFKDSSASLIRGDKIALIGPNGLGKSTLLKIIAGTIPFEGVCTLGYNVIFSYYAQHQIDSLNYKNSILEELISTDSSYTELELRSVLGSFLFSGDDVFKKIGNLSGGEKARVALAKVLISKANFLIMDEPTNHLDIASVDILTSALQKFKGSLIMVSHDRRFIDSIANKIWYIESKKVKEYPGTYYEYELWEKDRKFRISSRDKTSIKKTDKSKKEITYINQKKNRNKLNSLKSRLAELESRITDLETKKKNIEDKMLSPEIYTNYEKITELSKELENIGKILASFHNEWEEKFIKIDKIESDQG